MISFQQFFDDKIIYAILVCGNNIVFIPNLNKKISVSLPYSFSIF